MPPKPWFLRHPSPCSWLSGIPGSSLEQHLSNLRPGCSGPLPFGSCLGSELWIPFLLFEAEFPYVAWKSLYRWSLTHRDRSCFCYPSAGVKVMPPRPPGIISYHTILDSLSLSSLKHWRSTAHIQNTQTPMWLVYFLAPNLTYQH